MALADLYSNVTPDLPSSSISDLPSNVLQILVHRDQETDTYYGVDETVYNLTTDALCEISIKWNMLTEAEATAILDIYFSDAIGMMKSFIWVHPTDGYSYVVRFNSKLTHIYHNYARSDINTIKLKILGTYNA